MSSIQKPQRIRGTQDMIGETAARFDHVVAVFERVRRLYGFQPVQVPVFEATSVFSRSLGETTAVVAKEKYTFHDRGGDSMNLTDRKSVVWGKIVDVRVNPCGCHVIKKQKQYDTY